MSPETHLLTTREQLANAVTTLLREARVAIDCESNGMHAYRARLCTVQLCGARADGPARVVFVLDGLAVEDLAPLGVLLGPRGPTALLHDAFYDAFLLATAGLSLTRVVDTAVHARFLGLKETGLSSLLRARYDVHVSKALQAHDWARRPLEPAHLAYLRADVEFLGPLAAQLEAEARAAGIADEIAVETDYLLANARADAAATAPPPHQKVKGSGDLDRAERLALKALADERERWAERLDLPPGRLVNNAALLALARSRPGRVDELRRSAGLHGRGVEAAPALLAALERAARGEVPDDEPGAATAPSGRGAPRGLSGSERAARRAREGALTAWRLRESAARAVDPQVVLPGHALSDLAAARPRDARALLAVPGLGPRRVERYGAAWLRIFDELEAAPVPGRG